MHGQYNATRYQEITIWSAATGETNDEQLPTKACRGGTTHGVARPVFFQKERISTCCRLLCELLRVVLSEHKSMFPFIVEVFLTRGCVQRST